MDKCLFYCRTISIFVTVNENILFHILNRFYNEKQ